MCRAKWRKWWAGLGRVIPCALLIEEGWISVSVIPFNRTKTSYHRLGNVQGKECISYSFDKSQDVHPGWAIYTV